ncbi:MAG: DinB family protein [Ignavibacteria bacterium]|nr:DinB family protein [Ignavibacteria bacterium]
MNQSELLAEALNSVRNLTKFYFSKINPEDLEIQMEVDGIKFNSPKWLAAHLAWTENFLLLQGIGGKTSEVKWLEEYGFGSNPDELKSEISFEEIMKTLDEIHNDAINHLISLSDEQLEEKNLIGANFGGKDTIKAVVIHAIRHEPMHTGQISWFLKYRGVTLT